MRFTDAPQILKLGGGTEKTEGRYLVLFACEGFESVTDVRKWVLMFFVRRLS